MQQIIALLRNRTYLISFRGSFKTHKPMLQCLGNSYVQRTHGKLKQTAKNFLHVRHNILSQPKQDNFLLFSNRFFFSVPPETRPPAATNRTFVCARLFLYSLCPKSPAGGHSPCSRSVFEDFFFSLGRHNVYVYPHAARVCLFMNKHRRARG